MDEPIITELPKKKKGRHCKNCGLRIIEYPIYKGQEEGLPFIKGDTPQEKWKNLFTKDTWNKDWNWKNVLIGDWTKTLTIITILLMAWSYGYDVTQINKIKEDPCDYVNKNARVCEQAANLKAAGVVPKYILNFSNNNTITLK